MRKNIVCILTLFCIFGCFFYFRPNIQLLQGADVYTKTAFVKANRAFAIKDYEKAVKYYCECIQNGHATGELFYDLGNVYLMQGDISRAILNYERAYLYMPRCEALNFNYDIALQKVKQAVFFPFVLHEYTQNEIYMLMIFLFFVLVISFSFSFFRTKIQALCKIISLLLLICVGTCYFEYSKKVKVITHAAIILPAVVDMYSAPIEGSETITPLYAGNIVLIRESISAWCKVEKGVKQGWVKKTDLEKIMP